MKSIRILLVTDGGREVNIKSDLQDPSLLKVYGLSKWPTRYSSRDLHEIAAAFTSAAAVMATTEEKKEEAI